MKIGIYSRILQDQDTVLFNQIENGLKFMCLNGYNSCKVYQEIVPEEFSDISERIAINEMVHDAEMGAINAVYVENIKLFSPLSIKALQVIISLQELGINVYHCNGYFDANDENVKIFKKHFEDNWQRIHEITKDMNLGE
jgi:DNA invertase Pin-like site-specific DNA recombinase